MLLSMIFEGSVRIMCCLIGFCSRRLNCVYHNQAYSLKIVKELHDVGHIGRDKTYQLVANSYYWTSMRREAAKVVER